LGSAKAARTVVRDGQGSVTVEGCGPVVVNAGQAGYYRTAYSAAYSKAWRSRLPNWTPEDQLGLMGDSWALTARACNPSATTWIWLMPHLGCVAQLSENMASNLSGMAFWYQDNANRRRQFEQFAIQKLAPIQKQLGWTAAANEWDPWACCAKN